MSRPPGTGLGGGFYNGAGPVVIDDVSPETVAQMRVRVDWCARDDDDRALLLGALGLGDA